MMTRQRRHCQVHVIDRAGIEGNVLGVQRTDAAAGRAWIDFAAAHYLIVAGDRARSAQDAAAIDRDRAGTNLAVYLQFAGVDRRWRRCRCSYPLRTWCRGRLLVKIEARCRRSRR